LIGLTPGITATQPHHQEASEKCHRLSSYWGHA